VGVACTKVMSVYEFITVDSTAFSCLTRG
jgi:hypothetical protein